LQFFKPKPPVTWWLSQALKRHITGTLNGSANHITLVVSRQSGRLFGLVGKPSSTLK